MWKHNIGLYYKDKYLITDKIVLEILDKSYKWLYNFITDDLNNLGKYKIKNSEIYNHLYYKMVNNKRKFLFAYNKMYKRNDIDRINLLSNLDDYMTNYYNKYFNENHNSEFSHQDISLLIIRGYLNYVLNMEDYEIGFFEYA